MSTKNSPPEVVSNQGADDQSRSDDILAEPESIAAQLRRRREASHRMPPLPDGRREPWDLYPSDGAA
jgi:hypothetical protein